LHCDLDGRARTWANIIKVEMAEESSLACQRELVICERMCYGDVDSCGAYALRRALTATAHLPEGETKREMQRRLKTAARASMSAPQLAALMRSLRKQLADIPMCSAKKFLLDPRFNLGEMEKNLALFADHLSAEEKICPDCLHKHLLLVEAFLDEALGLDAERERYRSELLKMRPDVRALRVALRERRPELLKRSEQLRRRVSELLRQQ
jgi:hypothetical protein